jgi:hypothetical protein
MILDSNGAVTYAGVAVELEWLGRRHDCNDMCDFCEVVKVLCCIVIMLRAVVSEAVLPNRAYPQLYRRHQPDYQLINDINKRRGMLAPHFQSKDRLDGALRVMTITFLTAADGKWLLILYRYKASMPSGFGSGLNSMSLLATTSLLRLNVCDDRVRKQDACRRCVL